MKVLAPFFAILASCATIFAAIVRLWWSKPKFRGHYHEPAPGDPYPDGQVLETKGPSWLQTTAKWWLRIVVFGLTVGALIVVITIAVRIINISN